MTSKCFEKILKILLELWLFENFSIKGQAYGWGIVFYNTISSLNDHLTLNL